MSETTVQGHAIADLEIHLLLDAVYRVTGHDFREYTPSALRRRIIERVRAEHVSTVSGLQERVLHDPACMERLIHGLSVAPISLFRDPAFFAAFRSLVVPLLRTYPFVRIWNAGCSIGEDAYAIAILLEEEGLGHRCRIYATSPSESAVAQAKDGQISAAQLAECAAAYAAAGGNASFERYVERTGDRAVFVEEVRRNIVFAQHTLAGDGSFNDFHVVVARQVFGNFTKGLQVRVHALLLASLVRSGVLALGERDSIEHTPHEHCYQVLDAAQHLYRRIR